MKRKLMALAVLVALIPAALYGLPRVWQQNTTYSQTTGWKVATGTTNGRVGFTDSKTGVAFRAKKVFWYAADGNIRIARFRYVSSFSDTLWFDGGMDLWTGGFTLDSGRTFQSEVGIDGFRWATHSGLTTEHLYYEAVR